MVHIAKTQTGFEVATLAENGEVDSASEVLQSKQNCWKNVRSHCIQWNSGSIRVQDDTGKKSAVYRVYISDKKLIKIKTTLTPDTKYIPKTVKPKYTPKKK